MKKRFFPAAAVLILMTVLLSCSGDDGNSAAEALELSVRNILEIPAYEQIYRDIVYIGEEQKVLFFTTTDKRLLFSVDIKIQAGIRNADNIKIELSGKTGDGQKAARVYVPRSEILLVDADESSIEQYFIKEQGGDISRLDYYNEINAKKDDLVKTAIESGLLEKADSNVQKLIRGFLELSGIHVSEFREVSGNG